MKRRYVKQYIFIRSSFFRYHRKLDSPQLKHIKQILKHNF